MIQDISATNRARIEKVDVPAGGTPTTGADSVVLRGIRIYARAGGAGKTFTLTYKTDQNDLSAVSSTSGNYAGTAKMKGQFRLDSVAPLDGLSGAIAATCNSGTSSPCAQLSVRINLISLNGTGSNLSTLITASIPCSTTSTTTSPCGSGGFYSPLLVAGDQFLATDTGSVGCGTTCNPFWEGTLKVKFSATNQAFTLSNSAGVALAPDTPQGLVDSAVALGEPGIDVWVGTCSGADAYRVTGEPPFGNLGRNQTNLTTFPMKFSLEKRELLPVVGGFPKFVSIDDPLESILPPGDRERNNACSMSWVPSPASRPKFSAITHLELKFLAFVTGAADSGDPRLGTLNFASECEACFRVEIELVDGNGIAQGTLRVYLGANAADFFRVNNAATAPLALIPDANGSQRVDASGMNDPQACCISVAEAQKNSDFGKYFVRSITVVIDPGLSETLDPLSGTGSHLVTNLEAIVNSSSSNSAMLTVGAFQPSCDWPSPDGLKIYVYRKLANGDRQFVFNVVNPVISSCKLTASPQVGALNLGPGTYEATVVASSAAEFANIEFIGGTALPDPGMMLLK